MSELVTVLGNRACIGEDALILTIGADTDLGEWITRNCEYNPVAQVWLLPVFADE